MVLKFTVKVSHEATQTFNAITNPPQHTTPITQTKMPNEHPNLIQT